MNKNTSVFWKVTQLLQNWSFYSVQVINSCLKIQQEINTKQQQGQNLFQFVEKDGAAVCALKSSSSSVRQSSLSLLLSEGWKQEEVAAESQNYRVLLSHFFYRFHLSSMQMQKIQHFKLYWVKKITPELMTNLQEVKGNVLFNVFNSRNWTFCTLHNEYGVPQGPVLGT